MKNRAARILSIGIALAAVTAVSAQNATMTANVPFSFYMGTTVMPQGAYRVNEIYNGSVVWMQSMQSGAAKTATTHNAAGATQTARPRLVFHRYGGDYFLAEIWTNNASAGQALARSSREKELAQSGAAPRLALIQVSLHR